MTSVIINPGAGPAWAWGRGSISSVRRSVRLFVREVACGQTQAKIKVRIGERKDDGRWMVVLAHGRYMCTVSMPGIPYERLILGPWKSPRLYVDGSSWLWEFAISQARWALGFRSDA